MKKHGPTKAKVTAAAGGATFAGSLVTLVAAATGWDPSPAEVGAAITILSSIGAFIAGWLQSEAS